MLIKAKTLKGYKLNSLDGEIGKVKEFYFDDHHWTIRYLVADTGNWLTDRQVLIPPCSLIAVNKEEEYISINLTKKQLEDSPSLSSDKPVSRQFEEVHYGHFGWQQYWAGPFMGGLSPNLGEVSSNLVELSPNVLSVPEEYREAILTEREQWDSHLHSTHDMSGHDIQASDGGIGHIDDFIIDDETWAIRYLVIDTQNWLPGKKVLISLKWIERISWDESKIFVKLTREAIKQSPEYTDNCQLNRDYETVLHTHYNCRGYWADEPENADKKNQ